MQLHWQLKASQYAKITILCLSLLPLVLSLLLPLTAVIQIMLLLLTPILFFLLINNMTGLYSDTAMSLSWNDGVWVFNNANITVEGLISEQSFSLGAIIFLSIKDPQQQSLDLWLWPDSIHSYQHGWRQLHCCFHLSKMEK